MLLAPSAKERWIADTQMFQRVARVPESSAEELGKEWDAMQSKQKKRESINAETNRVILEQAVQIGDKRTG